MDLDNGHTRFVQEHGFSLYILGQTRVFWDVKLSSYNGSKYVAYPKKN